MIASNTSHPSTPTGQSQPNSTNITRTPAPIQSGPSEEIASKNHSDPIEWRNLAEFAQHLQPIGQHLSQKSWLTTCLM